TVVIPLIERAVIDNVIVTPKHALWPLLALLIGLGALNFVLSYLRRFVGGRFAFDVQHDMRTAIYERLQRLDFARHDQLPTGQIVSRASSDLGLVQSLLSFLPLATGNVVLLFLSLIVMLVLSPLLTVIVLATVPALLFVSLKLRQTMFPAQWDSLQRAGEVAGVVDEAVNGVRVVKGFGQEDRELAGLTDAARGLYRSRVRTVRLQARYASALQAIPALGQVGVLALGGWLALHGQISIGTFLAFSTYLVQLLAPVRMFAGMVAVAQQARAGTERIFELLDSNPLVTERPDAPPLQPKTARIDFDHVSYGYLRSEPVLRDFSLHVASGETVALVGTSGSGKSTVSLLLPRFYDVQEGSIRIDGTDVRDVTLESVRNEIGIVFEDAFLFSDTVCANIAYGRPDATDDDVTRAAQIAGADEFIRELPFGYDTVVGERGLTLSGGQRQRISIARAVITDPRLLVLDDATSSVDTRTEEQIHATLREIMAGRTTILIAHRRSTLQLADRIVLIVDGRAAESGTHEELLATSARYRALLAGPGDLVEGDPVPDDDVGFTPALWERPHDADAARAFIAPSGPAVARTGLGGSGAAGRGVGGAVALEPTPELLAAVAALPPADDDPDIDVATEAAASEHFRLRDFLRPYRRALLIGFGLVVVDTLLTLAGPFLVQQGLNQGVQQHAQGALWVASLLFLGTTLVDWVVTWAYTRYTGRTAERLLFALRIRIFSHLQRLALDYYDREMSGRIMTRMTTDVDAFAQLLQTGIITALVNVLSFVGVLVVLSFLSWPLTLGVLVLVPPLLLTTVWFGRRSARAYAHARETISTVNAEFQESLSGVRETQAYVREDRNISSFRATAGRYLDARIQTQWLQALYFPFILFLATCGDAIVLGLGTTLVHNGTIATGTVIAFLLYLDQFFAPIQQLSQVFDQWQQAVASMTKINELMLTPIATPDAAAPIPPGPLQGAIRFDDVHFSYPGTGRETLHGIDLEVAPGETVALVGETGAGKSTLVKLVARFYDADAGAVLIDGIPIRDLDLRAYRRRLGYVPQEPFLFSGTIRDNIAYGRPDAPDEAVEQAARAVGAHEFVAGLRGGYLHPVTERGRSLSAGQRQLICLARALLVDPAILLLDEATANLDLSTEARVQRAMGLVARNRTTLLIAHRLQTARAADRIVVVDDGRIVESGSHDDLLAAGGSYAELWNRNLDASISRYAASRPS
ncbi:MAG: ATP-binding cassette, subfamily bacterial, partial [Actinomycetota bacterium]|nr:ATP-binding cassette, subfamily bacterial [Actinomycetota bacterium]